MKRSPIASHRSCCSPFIFEILDFYPISLPLSLSCFFGRKLFSAVTEALHLPEARPKGGKRQARKERVRAQVASFLLSDSFRCGQALCVAERVAVGDGCQSCAGEQSGAGARAKMCQGSAIPCALSLLSPLVLDHKVFFSSLAGERGRIIHSVRAGRSNVERTNGLERV